MGGKFRQGPKIASIIQRVLRPGMTYVEPFCGALGVATHINSPDMILSDVSPALINMWKTLQDPPYKGRTKAHNCAPFDHDKYWEWCRNKTKNGHIVVCTEFIVPDDFVVLYNFGGTVVRHYSGKPADGTSEVLVCHKSQANLWGIEL
jgi:hypothetical protein